MNLVSFLFGFNGRINRVQYWLGCIGTGVGGAMLFFVLGLMTLPAGGMPKTPEGVMSVISSMGITFGVPMFLMGWIGSALQVKRFHDRGRSGLLVLLPMLPVMMIVTSVISGAAAGAPFADVMSSITLWFALLQLINLFMFVDLGCMPSKAEPNKYGNPPGGGFNGGGVPAGGAPIPRQTSSPQPLPGISGSTLTGAESAIERAIAARSKQQAEAVPAPAAARPGMVAAQPFGGLRPAAPASFGRKASH